MRIIAIAALCAALGGCSSTVGRDVNYLVTEYDHAEPAVPVSVSGQDGPQTMTARRNPSHQKILVRLDSGSFGRALSKDLSGKDTALPQAPFEEAANKRLTEIESPNCHTTSAFKRQDYLWEFDYSCAPIAAAASGRRR